MNGSEDYKFGHIESDIKAINEKIDNHNVVMSSKIEGIERSISNLTQGIGHRVEKHGEEIEALKVKTENNENHIGWVSKKVDKWVFAFITAVVGLAGWIIKAVHMGKS